MAARLGEARVKEPFTREPRQGIGTLMRLMSTISASINSSSTMALLLSRPPAGRERLHEE